MKNVIFLSILLPLFGVNISFSQQATVTSGGLATGAGGTISYSIGQPFFTVISENKINIFQGVQQPFEISFVIVGLEEIVEPSIWRAFPNPTSGILKLKTDKIENLFFQITTLKGEIIISEKIADLETIINMNSLPATTYILKIFDKKKTFKTVKIVKY